MGEFCSFQICQAVIGCATVQPHGGSFGGGGGSFGGGGGGGGGGQTVGSGSGQLPSVVSGSSAGAPVTRPVTALEGAFQKSPSTPYRSAAAPAKAANCARV